MAGNAEQILFVVGIGPGSLRQMTCEVIDVIAGADVIVGYKVYTDLICRYFPGKEVLTTPMRQEEERCRLALETAASGRKVVFVCSGDAGVYGMAGLLYEMVAAWPSVRVQVLPGVSAALSGAALLGAPLVHDFACISLSDMLTPWEKIAARLRAAAQADFCIVLYNPASRARPRHLAKACSVLLEYLPPDRPCGYVEHIGREGERSAICTLGELQGQEVNMFTTVFIGNSTSRIVAGKLVTPRGYVSEGGLR